MIENNEDFKKYLENIKKGAPSYKQKIAWFKTGAELTERLLKKEHDKEMEDFAEWLETAPFYRDGDNNLWAMLNMELSPSITFSELLQLFRKEKENASNKG